MVFIQNLQAVHGLSQNTQAALEISPPCPLQPYLRQTLVTLPTRGHEVLQELLTGALLAASLLFWVFKRKKGKRAAKVGASCEGFLAAAAAQGVPPRLLHSVPFPPCAFRESCKRSQSWGAGSSRSVTWELLKSTERGDFESQSGNLAAHIHHRPMGFQ